MRLLVALLLLSYICFATINVLWLFLTVPLVGLQYVIVVFPDHSNLLFEFSRLNYIQFSVVSVSVFISFQPMYRILI